MKASSPSFLTSLASLALAIASGDTRTDYYDDLVDTPGVGPPPRIPSDGVREGGIVYDGQFGYVTQGGALETDYTGIKAVSGRKVALISSPATGNITVSPEFRCVKLERLFRGCTTTNLQATLNVPLRCSVTVEAFNLQGEFIGSQTLQYTPNNRVLADMGDFVITLPATDHIRFTASIVDATPFFLLSKILLYPFSFIPALQEAYKDWRATVIVGCGIVRQ